MTIGNSAHDADEVAGFIREQPHAVAATYGAIRAALKARALPHWLDIALVGSGSSFNALSVCSAGLAAASGTPIHLRGPTAFMADLAAGHLRPNVAVVLSQSGASVTTIEAARMAQELGAELFRITAEASSLFAQLAPGALVMPIGPEPIGPKTKGYAASLAALAALTDWVAGRDGAAPEVAPALVEASRVAAEALLAEIAEPDFVLVVGQGAHFGTALEASLKIAEMSGIPAAGLDTEEALHGRLHGLTARSLAIFIAGDAAEAEAAHRTADIMRGLGVVARVVGPAIGPDVFHGSANVTGPELDPIHAIVPFQWLAWALARRRGLDPARMRYPGLSQRLAIKTSAPS